MFGAGARVEVALAGERVGGQPEPGSEEERDGRREEEERNSMTMRDAPEELADTWTRLYRAKENYDVLADEVMHFLYEYVQGMVKGRDPETGSFVLRLRDGRASIMTGRPRALVVDIVEDLRAALDYMVFELSVLNTPDLNEQAPQFVIADTKEEFDQQSRRRLRYLTEEQKTDFIEKLQPFNGNHMLATLRDISGQSKHRRLLSVRDHSGWDIHMAEAERREEYKDWFMYPMEDGQAFFARPKSGSSIILLEKYDAMRMLKAMAEHVAKIVQLSHCFFEGRPFEMKVVQSTGPSDG